LVIDDFFNIGVKVGFLFDTLIDLLEEGLVDECFEAAHREMWHEILPITEVADTIEDVKDIFFQVIERFRFVFHAEPKHPR